MEELDRAGRIVYTESGLPYLKRYLDESKGVPLQDWWDDIAMVRGISRQDADHYPTEKPAQLIERVLQVASAPGDVVLDCFLGSGTTASVAQRLGRRWIGCDINKGAIQTTAKRLMRVVEDQREAEAKREAKGRQGRIEGTEAEEEAVRPAQWGFTTWRVNDYDLALKTTEAVGLACEHLGVERTRTDRYFDGTLGKRLVKIVPFDHPLTPLDLDELRKELDARPDEDRDVVVAAIGCEIAARSWVDD